MSHHKSGEGSVKNGDGKKGERRGREGFSWRQTPLTFSARSALAFRIFFTGPLTFSLQPLPEWPTASSWSAKSAAAEEEAATWHKIRPNVTCDGRVAQNVNF